MPALVPPILSHKTIDKAFADGAFQITDGGSGGLHCEFRRKPGVTAVCGAWRLAYRNPTKGKQKLFFGLYPEVGLALARERAKAALAQIASGEDPASTRKAAKVNDKVAHALATANKQRAADGKARIGSFRDYAEQYVEVIRGERMASYVNECATALNAFAYPAKKDGKPWPGFGDKRVQDVTADDIAAWDTAMSERGKRSMHKKARRFIEQVFQWCMDPDQKSIVKACPVFKSRRLKAACRSTPRPSVVSIPGQRIEVKALPGRVRTLVNAVHNWRPQTLEWQTRGQGTRHAMLLTMWTAQRIGTIVSAEKTEFDLDIGVWTIPAAKMKGRREWKEDENTLDHVVYLPRQAVAMLREQFAVAPTSPWVFPGQRNSKSGHMNRSTTGTRLKEIGMDDEHKHSSHGFRALLRTAGKVCAGLDPVKLEVVLGHSAAKDTALDGGMPGIYDREGQLAHYDDSLQRWADWLDTLLGDEAPMQEQPLPEEALLAA